MNIFKDLFAGVRDIVGGRSEAVQKTMRDSRKTALYELKKEAYEVGANAVVGVDLDYVEMSSCWLYGDADCHSATACASTTANRRLNPQPCRYCGNGKAVSSFSWSMTIWL